MPRLGVSTSPWSAARSPGRRFRVPGLLLVFAGGAVLVSAVVEMGGRPGRSALTPLALGIGAVGVGAAAVALARARRESRELHAIVAQALAGAPEASAAIPPGTIAELAHRADARLRALESAGQAQAIDARLLRFERDRLRSVLDEIPEGVVVTDALGGVTYLNRPAAMIFGAPAETAIGRPVSDLRAEFGSVTNPSSFAVFAGTAGNEARQFRISRHDAGERATSQSETVFTLRDVTAQQSADRAQVEFLSQIAHELKSPLNTIVTYADALADDSLVGPDERRHFFNTISSEAQRMGDLITNLLEMSRIRLGSLSARQGFVKTSALLGEIAASFRSQATAAGLTLTVSVPENLPPLHADKDLIGVAVSNLVSNAVKYTRPGGTISLRAEADATGVAITVEDDGIGIPAELRSRIFERFTRSDQAEVRSRPGSGLGLALVKEIIDVHGGTVTVESQVDRGSRFTISIPVRQADARIQVTAA
jgi:PAS domain S-box-containing protein